MTAPVRGSPIVPEPTRPDQPLHIFLVAGEHSGDVLGAGLMAALRELTGGSVRFSGLGGELMEAQGLTSIFPMHEVAVMGPKAILERLPHLLRRIGETADAVLAGDPDVLVLIDAPELTHRIAKRVRKARPAIPIVDYVSPSVWAWRPWRARSMRAYVDEVLALLPFEPDAHLRLGGPPCTYVGHPIVERLAWINALDPGPLVARLGLDATRIPVLMLPGSRRSEVSRLMKPYGATLAALKEAGHRLEVLLPTVASVHELVRAQSRDWPCPVHVLSGEDDKFRAFKLARAALAASGTVTLELAAAGCPMVVTYKVDRILEPLRWLIHAEHFALANLILGERAFPELMQQDCRPNRLAPALAEIMAHTPARERQLAALARIPAELTKAGTSPRLAAARRVLANVRQRASAA